MTILLLSERAGTALVSRLAAWLHLLRAVEVGVAAARIVKARARASNFQTVWVQWPLAAAVVGGGVDWCEWVDAQSMDGPGSGHAHVPP